MLLRRDALKQTEACKVFRNVLVKKLQTGKSEIVMRLRYFSMTLLLFSNCVQALERNMS